MYEIEEYVTDTGESPFTKWLEDLRDLRAKAKILARIRRASIGNFGDWKNLENAQGIFEMREHFGPGYRIYFSFVGKTIILLLTGSDKGDQNRTISIAKRYWDDYQRRAKS